MAQAGQRGVRPFPGKRADTPLNFLYLCRIACKHVAKVTLSLQQKAAHAYVNKRLVNSRIAMGVIGHGLANNICNLVELAIMHFKQRMHDAALHRL